MGDGVEKKRKVVFCVPTITRPYQCCLDSLAASIPLIKAAGWEEGMANSIGCPYISRARQTMLRKAMVVNADVIVFIDHDLSWKPKDLLTLLETEGDVVAGTYRFKNDKDEYMGALIPDIHNRPQVRDDGCLKAHCVPAGFLKITRNAVNRFTLAYPELMYVDEDILTVDLFNHGAYNGIWYGEDYSFCRRWLACGGEVWIVPDLDLDHHLGLEVYEGNYHRFLLRQDGGSESDCPERIAA